MTNRDPERIPQVTRARLAELGAMVKAQRTQRGLNLRDLAFETGLAFNTLSRVERGLAPDLVNFFAIVEWLDVPPGWFSGAADAPGRDAYQRGWDDCAAAVSKTIERRGGAA